MRAISSRWLWRFARARTSSSLSAISSHAESYTSISQFVFIRASRMPWRSAGSHVSRNVNYVSLSRDAPKTTDERRQRESSRNRGTATAARGRGVTGQTRGMRCVNRSVTIERERKGGRAAAGISAPWSEIRERTEAKRCSESVNLKKKRKKKIK